MARAAIVMLAQWINDEEISQAIEDADVCDVRSQVHWIHSDVDSWDALTTAIELLEHPTIGAVILDRVNRATGCGEKRARAMLLRVNSEMRSERKLMVN